MQNTLPLPGRSIARRAGFTLIELLAVLLILGILSYFLITNLGAGKEGMKESAAKNHMAQIAASLAQVSDETGNYPFSKFAGDLGTAPNEINVGAECLYLALCAQGAPGYGTLDKPQQLCNTDLDSLSKRPKGFETQALFELADPWGNPIAYIHRLDYEREFHYRCLDPETGELDDF